MKISEENTIKTTYIQAVYDNFRGILPDYFLASMQYRVGLTSAVAIPKKMVQGNFLFNPELNGQEDLELFTKIAIHKPVAITNKYTVEYNFAIENNIKQPVLFINPNIKYVRWVLTEDFIIPQIKSLIKRHLVNIFFIYK